MLPDVATPARTRAAWWALAFVGLVSTMALGSWWIKARDNAVIAGAQAMAEAKAQGSDSEFENTTPALVFAQAHELASAEQLEPALLDVL